MNRDQPGPKQNMATPSLSMGHPELLFNWPNLTHLILLHQFPRFITPKAAINPKFGTPPQDKKGADYFTCASTFLSSNKVKSWFCWIVLLLLIIHITWHLSQMSKPRGIQWPEPRELSFNSRKDTFHSSVSFSGWSGASRSAARARGKHWKNRARSKPNSTSWLVRSSCF